jgi:hypothetical protein
LFESKDYVSSGSEITDHTTISGIKNNPKNIGMYKNA